MSGVDPRLVEVAKLARIHSPYPFEITEGMRDEDRQRQLVAKGASQTMNSRHLHGNALDFHILNEDGTANWDFEKYREVAASWRQAAQALGVDIEWGGDWKTLRDGPHIQLAGENRPRTQIAGGAGVATMAGGEKADLLTAAKAELSRRKALEQAKAELARRQQAKAPEAARPERDAWGQAAAVMVNDLNAGFQGVNPVATAKARPAGAVDRAPDGTIISIDVDGVKEDPAKYPGSRYVIQSDPKTGAEYVYARTEAIDDPTGASVGRVLGFGLPSSLPTGATTAAAKPAAEALGITPSLGMTGKAGAMAAGAGEAFIGTGGIMARDAARASDEITGAAARIADSAGPGANSFDGGSALQRGAGEFRDAFKAKADDLFAEVDRAIPKGTKIELRNAAVNLEEMLTLFREAPNIKGSVGLSELDGWAKDIVANNGQLPWETVKALRSEIGAAIGKMKGPLADQADGRLKALYAALTDDMARGAEANGALGKWLRANTFYARGQQRINDALDVVFSAKSSEQAFERVFALTADKGGAANIKKLLGIKKSMSPDEWSSFVGTTIRRIGAPSPGSAEALEGAEFSASTFLTNWNKMSPSARNVLFRGKGVPKTLAPALDNLAEVASDAKRAGIEVNRSRSGQVVTAAAAGGGLMAAPVTTAATIILANLSARALTQPGVIRAVASLQRTGSLAALQRLAKGQGPAAVEAANLLRLAEQTE